jgi:hypothetical protein
VAIPLSFPFGGHSEARDLVSFSVCGRAEPTLVLNAPPSAAIQPTVQAARTPKARDFTDEGFSAPLISLESHSARRNEYVYAPKGPPVSVCFVLIGERSGSGPYRGGSGTSHLWAAARGSLPRIPQGPDGGAFTVRTIGTVTGCVRCAVGVRASPPGRGVGSSRSALPSAAPERLRLNSKGFPQVIGSFGVIHINAVSSSAKSFQLTALGGLTPSAPLSRLGETELAGGEARSRVCVVSAKPLMIVHIAELMSAANEDMLSDSPLLQSGNATPCPIH